MELRGDLIFYQMSLQRGLQLAQMLLVNASASLANDRLGLLSLIRLLKLTPELLLLLRLAHT